MPRPTRLIPIPRTLAAALGLLALVLVVLLAPPGWHIAGAAAVACLVAVTWLDDRWFVAHQADRAAHARALGELESRATELDANARAVRAVVDAVPTPILVITARGRVAMSNPSATDLLATDRSPPLGRELEDLIPHPELLALFDQARTGTGAAARLRLILDGATRFFDVRTTTIPSDLFPDPGLFPDQSGEQSESSRAVVLSLEDVTSLAETVRLKTDFAANASHELRTPIAAIRGAVETLAVAKDDAAMTDRLHSMIARHATRLEELVKDLLDLSQLEAAQTPPVPERVDLASLAGSLEAHSEPTRAARGVGLIFEIDPALEGLHLDPGLLELILRNLIDNACKFAHPETDVRVLGEPAGEGEGEGTLGAVRFSVIDQGRGIPLKDQQRVFERFFQVDPGRDAQREHRGTGLGLAIVRHAVRRLGGQVEIQSVLQEGTTVTVEFPGCLRPPS
ncbi:MAG: two-component system phosphate regulon sensor histidine kinase PhoR [Phycisphaerales bacterium]|jgi:two-component system phosphate regulon sensor histidine kinase PhoR